MASSSWQAFDFGQAQQKFGQEPSESETGPAKKRAKSTRQTLSCKVCKERKVKCDRTQPCSACCARGKPGECVFECDGDYAPISQGDEIRRLRKENERLRNLLRDNQPAKPNQEREVGKPADRKWWHRGTKTAAFSQQQQNKQSPNVYFGSPSLAEIVKDFANVQIGDSLTHSIPRGRDMYAPPEETSAYPFPILGEGTLIGMARSLLNDHDMVYGHLDMFHRLAQSSYFPHVPEETTKREIASFLQDKEGNAERHPDMLAMVFVTLAVGVQVGMYDACGGQWDPAVVAKARMSGDVYAAAAVQALRLGSFLNTPTLLVLQSLIMLGPYLTNSGRFLDAWAVFGLTIRLAHAIGLHRDPILLEPRPDDQECMMRRTLWWWILHMDQQYSVTLGRPLGVSGIGDCPPPDMMMPNAVELRLNQLVHHFTILARQILSSDGLMSTGKIDDFTDKLVALWETMPATLKFNESWVREETPLPEWPMDIMSCGLFAQVHSFIVLINRQRLETIKGRQSSVKSRVQAMTRGFAHRNSSEGAEGHGWRQNRPSGPPWRGRPLVIESSLHILYTFLFLHRRHTAGLISWTMAQHAFNACMILLLDARETENERTEWLVNEAKAVFATLHLGGVHKFAKSAYDQISRELDTLRSMRAARDLELETPEVTMKVEAAPDWTSQQQHHGQAIMGPARMFLIEDQNTSTYIPPVYRPLGWDIAGSAEAAHLLTPASMGTPYAGPPVNLMDPTPFPFASFEAGPSTQAMTDFMNDPSDRQSFLQFQNDQQSWPMPGLSGTSTQPESLHPQTDVPMSAALPQPEQIVGHDMSLLRDLRQSGTRPRESRHGILSPSKSPLLGRAGIRRLKRTSPSSRSRWGSC